MKSFIKLFFIFAVVMLTFSPLPARGQFMFDENPLVGKQAPDFKLSTTSGADMTLNDVRGDEPAILMFWATWCPSCREELRMLSKSTEALDKSGVKIILVNLEENPRQVKAYIDKVKLPYNVFLDQKSHVAEQYSVIGLPTAFFINREGIVVKMEFGLPSNFVQILNEKTKQKS